MLKTPGFVDLPPNRRVKEFRATAAKNDPEFAALSDRDQDSLDQRAVAKYFGGITTGRKLRSRQIHVLARSIKPVT